MISIKRNIKNEKLELIQNKAFIWISNSVRLLLRRKISWQAIAVYKIISHKNHRVSKAKKNCMHLLNGNNMETLIIKTKRKMPTK